ncbi:MAG TPA: mechanosensitive ion channel domain-containing protein [Methylomirabilota bacterium]|nr:mechanosensitive ion channel domain-containing protein [Methylomirabilota bacterium]
MTHHSGSGFRAVALAMLVLSLALVGVARGQTPAGDVSAKSEPSPAAAVPVAEIARRAEEVDDFRRTVEATVAPSARVASIESQLPALDARIAERLSRTELALSTDPSLLALDALAESWQATRVELTGWVDALTARAILLDQLRARLLALKETWTRTRAEVQAAGAPKPIVERTDGVLTAIETTRERLESARAETLVLQNRVARQLSRSQDAIVEVAQARRHATVELFVRESPPIWAVRRLTMAEAIAAVRATVETQRAGVRQFFRDEAGRAAVHAVAVLALGVVFWIGRRRARLEPPDSPLSSLAPLLAHPFAAAFVIGFISSFWVYTSGLRVARTFAEVGALVPLMLILRRLVPPPTMPGLYALTGFFLVDRIRGLFIGLPVLERYFLLLEVLAAVAVLAWFVREGRSRHLTDDLAPVMRGGVRTAMGLALVGFAVALVSDVFGNMSLARLVASGIFSSGYLALMLIAARRLASGGVSFALRVRPLCRLRMVQGHRPLIEGRTLRILRRVSVAVWIVGSLNYFGLLAPAWAGSQRLLEVQLSHGAFSISVGDVLAFVVTLWISFLLSAFIRFVLEEDVFPHVHLQPGVPYALSTFVRYAMVFVGFVIALMVLGVNLDRVTVLGGALGVGVGFGLQNIVNNFVSGLIVLFERPVRVGDSVQIRDIQGEIRRIGIRSSTVVAWEGAEVIVPNSMLVAEQVTNWTPTIYHRRVDIPVGVGYGTGPDEVVKLLLDVASAHPDVAAQPAPQALFLGFGDSALRFELRAWTNRLDRFGVVKSELGIAVFRALRGAGISIPFPQHEVRLLHDPSDADGWGKPDQARQPQRSPEGGPA